MFFSLLNRDSVLEAMLVLNYFEIENLVSDVVLFIFECVFSLSEKFIYFKDII